jgi:hypothetical protein
VRIKKFTVDASEVFGEGASVTFKSIKRGVWKDYLAGAEFGDDKLVAQHVLSWQGIKDDEGNDLPSPQDEPEILNELYLHEINGLARLLVQGPNGARAVKN